MPPYPVHDYSRLLPESKLYCAVWLTDLGSSVVQSFGLLIRGTESELVSDSKGRFKKTPTGSLENT